MKEHQVTIKIKAIVGVNVIAESPEAAMALVRERLKKEWVTSFEKVEVIDGHEEVIGANDNNWDLD